MTKEDFINKWFDFRVYTSSRKLKAQMIEDLDSVISYEVYRSSDPFPD